MNKCVLCFNLGEEKFSAVSAAALKNGIETKQVSQADFSQKLASLLELLPRENEICLSPFKEEMLIMAGLLREEMDSFLAQIRSENASVELKAVVTPYNLGWRCDDLLKELKKEHEAMRKQNKNR